MLAPTIILLIFMRLFVPPPAPLIYGPDTTVLTQPRHADGTINYVAALNKMMSQGVTKENNAFVTLALTVPVSAIMDSMWAPDKARAKAVRQELLHRLTLKPSGSATLYVPWATVARKAGLHGKPFDWSSLSMGLPPKVAKKLKDAAKKSESHYVAPFLPYSATDKPWSPKDLPVVNKWLQANRRFMAVIEQASKKPRYYAPLSEAPITNLYDKARLGAKGLKKAPPMMRASSHAAPIADYVRRDIAQNLFTAHMQRAIGAGDLKQAWSDVLVVKRLSRLMTQQPFSLTYLLAISTDAAARYDAMQIAASDAMTPALAKKMLADLQQLGPMSTPARSIDMGERFMRLDGTQWAWAKSGVSYAEHMSAKAWVAVADALAEQLPDLGDPATRAMIVMMLPYHNVNVLLRRFNHLYDQGVRMAEAKNFQAFKKMAQHASDQLDRQTKHMLARTTRPLGWFVFLLSPAREKQTLNSQALFDASAIALLDAMEAVTRTYWQSRMANDLSRVAIALGGYRAEHGHYPKSLNALSPEFLDHMPQDLFIDKPLHYRLEKGEKGTTAVVYSVGTNQKDDGGTGEGVENHDITVRLGP